MTALDKIKEWIDGNHLDVEWISQRTFRLNKQDYLCVSPKGGKVFDDDFNIIIGPDEVDEILVDNYCFCFGGKVYSTPVRSDKTQLNLLKHVGIAKNVTGYPYLGIHGGYELCSGSRVYEDWVQKAVFLGIKTIALVERHTLAGVLKFQQAANKAGIKSIVGETIAVKSGEDDYKVKLYVKDQSGWENLLRIHKVLNVDNLSSYVDEEELIKNIDGLICVFQADTKLTPDLIERYIFYGNVYFQFDPVQYKAENRDIHCLNCLKIYLNDYKDILPLALITDSYYLDQVDNNVRKILNFIGKGNFEFQSDDQYFKSFEDVAEQSIALFAAKGVDEAINIFESALDGTNTIAEACNFQIKTGEIHLPKYAMTEGEDKQFKNNEELFWHVIEKGIDSKIVAKGKDIETYMQRVALEYDVISRGGFQDYFLILRDIVNWCEENDIMVGTGRGSAGGSLIAMLFNITKVDPLEYGLIFERFLNESRIGKGLPDIDIDFASKRRQEVKEYIENRFGKDNVCSIGTYSTLQSKAAFRDLLRFYGEQPQNINYFGGMIDESNDDYSSIFHAATGNTKLKEFINGHLDAVQDIPLILGQPKSSSIHAAGVVVTPTSYNGRPMQIYDWFPCKMMDGVLVSEWEGVQLDDCGFLKADILGLTQLDKLSDMISMIKINLENEVNLKDVATDVEKIDLNEIDTKDKAVFDSIFKKGFTQDIFQFGTDGLAAYCREVRPESIEELAAMNALYRPGPMDSGAHTDYAKIKFGKKEPEYDWGTEEILKSTFGLYCYQEQIIKMVQVLAGFTLTEGDTVRKNIGKKLMDKMKLDKDKFVAGCIKNGCEQYEAEKIWNKIEVFAGYSFNLSHAVEYSLIGYQTAWLKHYYPLEFWTVSLQQADDDDIPKRVAEMRKFDKINLFGPDINMSRSTFYTDWERNAIYWSIGRIKQVAEVALTAIQVEKDKNGDFFSLEEFIKRCPRQAVNSRVVRHLIYSGCFDGLHAIEHPIQRRKLFLEFAKIYNIDPELNEGDFKEFFWYKQQRNLSGYGYFDYSTIVDNLGYDYVKYVVPDQIQMEANIDCDVVVSGLLVDFVKRKTKKGEMGKLTIDNNNDLIDVVLWNDTWSQVYKKVEEGIGQGIILNGKIQYDGYNKKNVVYSGDKTEVDIF